MADPFQNALAPFSLEEAALAYAVTLFQEKKMPRGSFLLRQGEVCHDIYFLLSGSVHMSYLRDGKQHIGDFMVEGEFVTDLASFHEQKPSRLFITCFEDCEVRVINRAHFQLISEKFPFSFERLNRLVAERNSVMFANRIWSMLIDSPEERYLQLLAEKPVWIRRFPLYLIASYLGLTPEGLSKIRRRLANEGKDRIS